MKGLVNVSKDGELPMFGLNSSGRGSEHVSWKDKTDRIIHFGSTGDPSFHIACVKLSV